MTLLKICGVTNIMDAQWIVKYADYVGVIVASSIKTPRLVDRDAARDILGIVGKDRAVAVVEGLRPIDAARLVSDLGFRLVQYHNQIHNDDLRIFGNYGLKVIPVVTYNDQYSLDDHVSLLLNNDHVKYVLVDAPKIGFKVYEGGLKIPIDVISKVSLIGRVGIAGGINPENAKVVMRYKPYLIDVSSGVEKRPGIKDEELVRKLYEVVKS